MLRDGASPIHTSDIVNPSMAADIDNDRYDEFVDLFSRNAKGVYGYIYAMLPHWEDADDVFQETSRVLWQKFIAFKSGTSFFAWAREIARYQVLSFRRRERRSRVTFTDAFVDAVAATADASVERLEAEQRALADCVETLKPREREIILLRFSQEATTKSVAEQLGMTTDAVYKAISRVQTVLLKCIEQALGDREQQ
jgi:RNA polymerase sigma-70 factor, ECF subfamily